MREKIVIKKNNCRNIISLFAMQRAREFNPMNMNFEIDSKAIADSIYRNFFNLIGSI